MLYDQQYDCNDDSGYADDSKRAFERPRDDRVVLRDFVVVYVSRGIRAAILFLPASYPYAPGRWRS